VFTKYEEAAILAGRFIDAAHRAVESIDINPERWVLEACCVHDERLFMVAAVSSDAGEVARAGLVQLFPAKIQYSVHTWHAGACLNGRAENILVEFEDKRGLFWADTGLSFVLFVF
jgi:hypothetical protein